MWGGATLIYVAALIAGPSLLGDFHMELAATYLTFSLVVLGLDLIWGYTGILNIGHFAFFGLGAYTVALLTTHLDSRVEGLGSVYLPLFVLAGSLVSGIAGLALAYLCFSLQLQKLFVLVTIAFAIVAQKTAAAQVELLGGINGIILPYWVVPADLSGYFRMILVITGIVFGGCWLITISPFGRVMLAVRDSEARAETLGYDTKAVKVVVFAVGSAIAGLGGGLYAILTGFVSPGILGFALSFDAVVWMMLGGMGTLYGSILGTLSVNAAKFYLSSALLEYWPIAVGGLFVLVVLFLPQGLAGLIRRAVMRGSPTLDPARGNRAKERPG